MLQFSFDTLNPAAKRAALAPYVGERVTLRLAATDVKGVLSRVSRDVAYVESSTIELKDIESVRIHVGGDWVSSEHRGSVLDAKLNVRCSKKQKTFIERAAKKSGVTTSEHVMDAALASASMVLGEKKPSG